MGHMLETLDTPFIPVIFDQNDTDFIMQCVDISGFRYKDQISEVPEVPEGEKLEVQDEATATFVGNCLARRIELARGLEATHRRTFQLVSEHKRPMPSLEHQENIRNSISRCQYLAAVSSQLIKRLNFDVVEVE